METFINVTHLPAKTRNAIAKSFGLKLDRLAKRVMIVVPGRLTGGTLVPEIEAAVRAAA